MINQLSGVWLSHPRGAVHTPLLQQIAENAEIPAGLLMLFRTAGFQPAS